MKVLLTGASGFVGSHILDCLVAHGIPTTLLLRPSSPLSFIQSNLTRVEFRSGSITDPATLSAALTGITHVIHCAGATKVVNPVDFHAINHVGTRNLVDAVNAGNQTVQRFIHLSSLAAAGPSTNGSLTSEACAPKPVSEYGRSKLAGELEVASRCKVDFTILRPPGVYGPRDSGFFSLFKAVRHHILPLPGVQQRLSLVFVSDLAEAVTRCLDHPAASRKVYFIASPEVVTSRQMAREIAAQMQTWTIPCPIPSAALWPVCLIQGAWSKVTNRASMLSLAKFPELCAPAWVCDSSRLHQEVGFRCPTGLKPGIEESLRWYKHNHWL